MLPFLLAMVIHPLAPLADPVPTSESYPLDICAVSGKKLGSMGEPIELVHEGRQVKFCCQGCVPAFKKEAAKYIENVDKKIIEAQKASYPLNTCVLSGEKLDEDAKSIVVNNRLVRVCCGGCVRKIKDKLPDNISKELDNAIIKKQFRSYTLTTCVISGEPLGSMGKPKNVVVGNTLVKVCCKGCISKVAKDPAKFIKMVKAAPKPADKKKEAGKSKVKGK